MMSAQTTLPIGPVVDSHPAKRPERVTLKGRWVTLVPLNPNEHAKALYEGSNGDAAREAVWTYLFDGPYTSLDEFRASLEAKARSTDPLFFAVIDNASGQAGGLPDLPAHRSAQSRHRGRQHPVHAGDAADGRRDGGAISVRRLMSSTISAIAVTNGNATPTTRRHAALRSASASRSREFSANT